MSKSSWSCFDGGWTGWKLDADGSRPTDRTYSPLIANWRRRIRGDGRRRIRLSRNGIGPVSNGHGDRPGPEAPSGDVAADGGEGGRWAGRRPTPDSRDVLPFPAVVVPQTAESSERPARGPLAWAYWSSQKT